MKTRHVNRLRSILLLISVLFVTLATAANAQTGEPYHLGVALGLTGTGAPYSREAVQGIEIAVNEINAQGGYLGRHPIKLFIRDTQTRPEVAEKVVTELQTDAGSIRRGLYGRTRAPFFAHLDNPLMAALVKNHQAKFDNYPSDWAVMAYDGVYALKQGIEKAGSIATEAVKDALKGLEIDTTRGRLFFRKIDNQLSVSAYFGRVSDDPRFPFPIYTELNEFKGPDIWRPEQEITAARGGKSGSSQ